MALDKLTIIDGGGLSTTSDYRVGVITATKFVGPVEGSITATDATFSGNVSIAGTLTYEDVTNVDSVGIITARNGIKVSTGTATTALVVDGDARVTGILTVGTSSLKLDGPNNLVNVGTALTLGHTQGVQFHTQNLHSAGFEVNQINASGIITASSVYVADSIIHQGDTDTKIDFANNQIKLTANNRLRVDLHPNNYNYFYGSQLIEADSTHPKAGSATYVARFRDTTGDDTVVHFHNTNVKNTAIEWNAYGNTSAAGNLIFRDLNTGKTEYARFTGTGSFNIAKDLDVDGHTNLDNVSIAGVSTFSNELLITNNQPILRFTESDTSTASRLITAGGQLYIQAGASGSGASTSNGQVNITGYNGQETYAKFIGDGAVELYHNNLKKFYTTTSGINVTGTTDTDNLYVSGSATIKASALDTDFFSVIRQDHSSTKLFRIFQDSSSGVGAGGCHINTNNRHLMITANVAAGADDGLYLTTGGNLGIGTVTPSGKLDISAAASTDMLMFKNGATNFARMGFNSASGVAVLDIRSEGHTRFLTNGNSEKVRITTDGVVSWRSGSTPLSGTSLPYSVNIYRDGGSGYGYFDTLTNSSYSTGVRIRTYNNTTYNNVIEHTTSKVTNFQTDGSTRLSITSDGQLNLGSRTAVTGGTTSPTHFRISRSDNAGAPLITMGASTYASGNASAPGAVISANHRDFIITKFHPDFSGNSPGFWLKGNEIIMYSGSSETVRLASNSRVGIGSDVPARPLSIGAGDGTVALHGGNAGIYIGTHPTGGFQVNCAIARAAANNYHITGSSVGDLCIAGESTKDIIIGTSVSAGAMNERMRFHHDGLVDVTGTGSGLAFNVGGGYIRSVGGQPSVVAHKSSSTFCHIGIEGNSNARAFLAYTNDKDFIIGRRTAYTGDNTGYSGADITIDKTNHAVQLSYNGGGKFVTTNDGAKVIGQLDLESAGSYIKSNQLKFNPSGAAYIDHGVTGQSLNFRMSNSSSLDTTAVAIASSGTVNIYGHLVLGAGINITGNNQTSGITKSATGFQFGPNNEHYLYQSATNEISLRISSDGPYAVFEDYSGEVMMGSNSGNLHLASGGNSRVLVTNTNTQFVGDIYLSGEINMTNGGNKNRFIDCSMDDGESLIIRSTVHGDANHENMATFTRNGACSFHFDASSDFKFQTASHGMNVHGDIHLGGQATSTNQNRKIYWTGFDKEATTDLTDTAEIRHAQNVHGISGSVLELIAQNDANDGIALNAAGGAGQIVFNGNIRGNIEMHNHGGRIRPSYGTGDKGIYWQPDPSGGGGDFAHIQYYTDGSGENTRLRMQIENDSDDDLRLEAGTIRAEGTFSASTKNFRIPHVLTGLTTTTDLVHSTVEGPQADNLYRGRTTLVAGISTVNIDTTNNMTDGTFVNLNRDVQCFTTNETGWTAIKGSVTGNLLTIIAQDNTCTDTISWMVIGERWDLAMYDPKNPMTDANGKIKTEIPNNSYNKGGSYDEDYTKENRHRVGISTISRPSIENKEVE